MPAEEAREEVLRLYDKLLRYRTRAERAEDRYLRLAPHVHAMAYAIGITDVPQRDDAIQIYPGSY
jgi:hypothetical protein